MSTSVLALSRLNRGELEVVLLGFQSQILDTRGGALAFRHRRRQALDGGGGGRREGRGGEGALVGQGGESGHREGGQDGHQRRQGGELRELGVESGQRRQS